MSATSAEAAPRRASDALLYAERRRSSRSVRYELYKVDASNQWTSAHSAGYVNGQPHEEGVRFTLGGGMGGVKVWPIVEQAVMRLQEGAALRRSNLVLNKLWAAWPAHVTRPNARLTSSPGERALFSFYASESWLPMRDVFGFQAAESAEGTRMEVGWCQLPEHLLCVEQRHQH